MHSQTTAAAVWRSKSHKERVQWLANDFLQWNVDVSKTILGRIWNPLISWDDWKQLEREAAKTPRLWNRYKFYIRELTTNESDEDDSTDCCMKADLPTRAKALFLAHQFFAQFATTPASEVGVGFLPKP